MVVDRELPQDVVGKQFTLAGTQCYILSAEGTRLAIATLGHLDVDAGNVFTLDDQRYQMKSATFLDSGDASIYQSFQAKAFQIGIDLVQPVTGENALRGVVELNDQVICLFLLIQKFTSMVALQLRLRVARLSHSLKASNGSLSIITFMARQKLNTPMGVMARKW